MKKNKPILYDPQIINRVKQYLEENVDKTYLDVTVMTKHLQDRYPEYARRKIAPFRSLVEQAYHAVSQSYGLDDQGSSGDDSDASDLEVMDDASNNLMSSMMSNLYAKSKNTSSSAAPNKSSAEAIDISSDESGDESNQSKSNGKSLPKAVADLPLSKNAAITVTKIPSSSNQESSSKGSSSAASNATDSNPLPPLQHQAGQKRHENAGGVGVSAAAGQPSKKRKLDDTIKDYSPMYTKNHPMTNQFNKLLEKNDNANSQAYMQQLQRHTQQLRQQSLNNRGNSNESDRPFNPASNVGGGVGGGGVGGGGQRARKYKKEIQLRKSRETFQDIGGMEKTLKELCELLMHIKSPDIYFVLGLMPPRGILLHGPPGCGKTLLAHAIAGQLTLPLIEIPATELIAGVSGESEERIRDVFDQAAACAPCVLFIDEIDAISSNRSMAQRDMERRIVSQLISSLDNLKLSEGGQSVLVIGATTRPDVLDPALRRVGRFDHEISIGIPTRKDRKDILTIICEGLSVEQKCDYDKIAELTPGYVGADLLALVSRAATIAVKRKCSEQMRAFQLKAQRNITIVDLDDDNEETDNTKNDKEKKTKEAVNDKAADNEDKKEDKEKEDAEKMSVETTKDIEKKNAGEKENKSEKSEETVSEDVEMADASKKKKDDEVESQTADATTAEKKSDTPPKTHQDGDIKVPEPTLFELLNWLDNPPEDITFVSEFCITLDDFVEAVKVVQPSAKREGFITVPDVTWDDVGSLQDIREELKLAVLAPVKFPEKLARLGLSAPSGVLLCGPPGCGKTLLAKAIANEAGINFISVKGPELMNMYVGESERAVRACFQRARNSSPCVIFFDEFDSLCPKRSDGNEGGSGTRVVNQLLTEMDGVEDRQGVYILAATNRPDIIDPAILRPGRLDTILYVGLPEQQDRLEILKASTKNGTRPVLADDVDFEILASLTDGYTGADLAGLVRQASMIALKESLNNTEVKLDDLCVTQEHFNQAVKMLRPSVSAQDRKVYDKLRLKYAAPRISITDLRSAE
ncbi:nuclear valosin-containing protein-like isoform X1 [Stomoxys calcitrans]|uniref:nuclear valosin-containing protein-like isoform X1 n=1 Tax=Stomoxys calcitrans TaxID=35570 RepID=UPI0027E2F200|nr:nuclear valosin-containing protein-like isoform X1 [Stomoxys calcitrans]